MARRGTSFDRRAQVLPLQPACRHADQATRRRHQGPLGLRAGPPATQRRTRPGPLRGAIMERPPPTRADVHDRSRLPPVPSPQAGQRGEKESPARRQNRACRPSDKLSLTASPGRRINHARTAGADPATLHTTICQSSARFRFRIEMPPVALFPIGNMLWSSCLVWPLYSRAGIILFRCLWPSLPTKPRRDHRSSSHMCSSNSIRVAFNPSSWCEHLRPTAQASASRSPRTRDDRAYTAASHSWSRRQRQRLIQALP